MDRLIRSLMVAAMAVVLVMTAVTTESKYVKTETVNLNLQSVYSVRYSYYSLTSTVTYIAPYNGYYAVLIKGGGGGNGNIGSGNSWTSRNASSNGEGETGGAGGVMLGVIHLDKDAGDRLLVYIGGGGGDSTGSGVKPSGATNPTSSLSSPLKSWGFGSPGINDGGLLNANASSGAGGAASIVFKNSASIANVVMIAGGGGGSAGRDKSYSDYAAGRGGAGGSNVFQNTLKGDDSVMTVTVPSNGNVYAGFDGTDGSEITGGTKNGYGLQPSAYNSFGGGGTAIGGIGNKSVSSSNYGNNGTAYTGATNSGTGGSVAKGPAGPGGGGYAGGGGGGGGFIKNNFGGLFYDLQVNPGGGGGGSSYIVASADPADPNGLNFSTELINEIYDEMIHEAETRAYRSFDRITTKEGFMVILYLGSTL